MIIDKFLWSGIGVMSIIHLYKKKKVVTVQGLIPYSLQITEKPRFNFGKSRCVLSRK